MADFTPDHFDRWLLEEAPQCAVVISSRARLARNLPRQPFAPRANAEQLTYVAETITSHFRRVPQLSRYARYELDALSSGERCFLRESHLISNELEKGGPGRLVFLNPALDTSVMINEEDHLRISTLISGFRLEEAYQRIATIEESLERQMPAAFSEEIGYLTACPTNVGTGLRLSVMMHLPALTLANQIESTLSDLSSYGLVVRGAYGEHSENHGDLYQISNEVTLGKTEEQILNILERIVPQIIERESEARRRLVRDSDGKLEDVVCRAIGLLATARRIDSMEAIALLSRARLGIGQQWGMRLDHPGLSRLFVEIQPAHLQRAHRVADSPQDRDQERAKLLRSIFGQEDGHARNN